MFGLTSLFLKFGWTRDDAKWLWIQILTLGTLISSGVFDLASWFTYIGVPVTEITIHRILAVVAVILYIGGKFDKSSLPGDPKK